MARDLFTNQATTTVSSGGTTAPAAGTTESWTVASSSTFPAASNTAVPTTQFYVVDVAAPTEIILVTNVSGTTWSVTRGSDSTTPVTHTAGFTIKNVVPSGWLQSIDDRLSYEVLSVKDYGALGNNSNADHVGIQAALDDAWNQGGGQVIVPKGIYRVMSAPLKIRSNVRLTLLPGAEIHRYGDYNGTSMVWNGDFSQNGINTNRAGWLGHGNIIIEGGVWDMRCTTATTALSSDTFTRANTTAPHTLGTTTTGGLTWTPETSRGTGDQGTGNLGITSSAVSAAVAGTNISTVYAWTDGTVTVDVSTVGTAGYAGLVFRVANSQNYWQYVRDNVTGNARLSYWVNSVETVVTPTATQAVSNGNTLKVVMFGGRIRTYVGATLTHDTTDTNFTANRKVGLIITDTTSRLDNFVSTGQMWTDTFDRTNSATSLGTTSSNYAWTAQSGTLGITSATLAYAPGAGTNISTVDVTSETNVEVKMTTVGNAGIIFRYQDVNNYWWYRRHTDGNARLSKFVAGVESVITPVTTTAVAANDILYVKVIGWTIRCWVNYSAATKATHDAYTHLTSDSDLYQASKVGIRIDDTTARLDLFDCYASSGGYASGACFNFGHGENILYRDLTVKDVSNQSHASEIAGCKNVLYDNCTFNGMSVVTSRTSEAIQMDITKGTGYFGAFGPHDNTCNRDVVVRECSFGTTGMPGTQAWDRGVGSHTGTVGVWHDHLRVTDCFFEVTQKAVRAYNWNNVFVKGNTMRTGSGIEVRAIDPTDLLDTINNAGVTTSGSQPINNVSIEGNILTCDIAANSNIAAIAVTGVITTGIVTGATIRGNDIRSTTCGGIYALYVDNLNIEANQVNSLAASDTGYHGIKADNTNNSLIASNQAFRIGSNGIYVTGGSTNARVTGNFVRGANRNNGSNSAFKTDGICNGTTWGGNSAMLWGSAPEPQYSFHVSNGTNHLQLANDWVAGSITDVLISAGDLGSVPSTLYGRRATDLTGLASISYADVTNLSVTIPVAGRYRFKAFIPVTMVSGTTPTMNFSVTGPTANAVVYSVATPVNNNTAPVVVHESAYLGNTTLSGTVTASVVIGVMIDGYADLSATGTFKVQYKVGGTLPSLTVKTGATLIVEKL